MALPSFLIVGAMKAGTTWLAYNLKQHPDIYMPEQEVRFFSKPENFDKGPAWYEKHFNPGIGKKAIGEKTPAYLLCRQKPSLIKDYLPDVKIIAVLRNPVMRIVSQVNHHLRRGSVLGNYPAGKLLSSPGFIELDRKFSILERSDYLGQVKSFHECFGAERFRVLINEVDIQKEPQSTLQDVCRFLEVDPNFRFDSATRKIHQSSNTKLAITMAAKFPYLGKPILKIDRILPGPRVLPFQLDPEDAKQLYDLYAKKNIELFKFLGRDMPESWMVES
jgi:hypothetical protein